MTSSVNNLNKCATNLFNHIEGKYKELNKDLSRFIDRNFTGNFRSIKRQHPKAVNATIKVAKWLAVAGFVTLSFFTKPPIIYGVAFSLGFAARLLPVSRGPVKEIVNFAKNFFSKRTPFGKIATASLASLAYLADPTGLFSGLATGAAVGDMVACEYNEFKNKRTDLYTEFESTSV